MPGWSGMKRPQPSSILLGSIRGRRSHPRREVPGRSTTGKCPEEPSILGRVPQSKLQRSQGFGQRPLRASALSPLAVGPDYPLIHDLRTSKRRIGRVFHRSSTGPRRRRSGGNRNARRNQSVRRSVAAMQAPRLGFVGPRSILVIAGASTCDAADGPLRPLQARPTLRARRGRGYGVIHELWPGLGHSGSVVHGPSTEPGDRGRVAGAADQRRVVRSRVARHPRPGSGARPRRSGRSARRPHHRSRALPHRRPRASRPAARRGARFD